MEMQIYFDPPPESEVTPLFHDSRKRRRRNRDGQTSGAVKNGTSYPHGFQWVNYSADTNSTPNKPAISPSASASSHPNAQLGPPKQPLMFSNDEASTTFSPPERSFEQSYLEKALLQSHHGVSRPVLSPTTHLKILRPGDSAPSSDSMSTGDSPIGVGSKDQEQAFGEALGGLDISEKILNSLQMDLYGNSTEFISPDPIRNNHQDRFQFDRHRLCHIAVQELQFLQDNGGFDLPRVEILDEMLQAYFLYVHPTLPLLHEGDFWASFDRWKKSPGKVVDFSPLLLFSMLFASCSFASSESIAACGYSVRTDAREAFFRIGKMLFDFDIEPDPISTAQAALLLSYHNPSKEDRKLRPLWVAIAAKIAMNERVHQYFQRTDISRQETLRHKRLWHCCIIRDRIWPLGTRHSLSITPSDFDFDQGELLTIDDLGDEIESSRVYDATTKTTLARLMTAQCKLCYALTGVIMLAGHMQHENILAVEQFVRLKRESDLCRRKLFEWYNDAVVEFPLPAGLEEDSASVILFTNLMYTYFNYALITLCHYEMGLWENQVDKESPRYYQQVQSNCRDIQWAVSEMTTSAKEFIQLRMGMQLPIAVAAFMITPLVLHSFDLKHASSPSEVAIRRRKLDIFEKVMKKAYSMYEDALFVSNIIASIKNFSEPSTKSMIIKDGDTPLPKWTKTWPALLKKDPKSYLRLTYFIDLSFMKERVAEEMDFPIWLRQT